jgi:hypothetical protein
LFVLGQLEAPFAGAVLDELPDLGDVEALDLRRSLLHPTNVVEKRAGRTVFPLIRHRLNSE